MKVPEYRFEEITPQKDTKYIFQVVKNRKLTNIYHSHDFYEWIIVMDGNATQIIDEEKVYMEKNTYLFLPPTHRHRFIHQTDNIYIISLSVEKSEMELFKKAYNIKDNLVYSSNPITPTQKKMLLDLSNIHCEDDLKLLLSYLTRLYVGGMEIFDKLPASLKTAMTEFNQTENMCMGSQRLAELSGYSKNHLNRLMKKHFNLTINQYVMNVRLESAYNSLIYSKNHMEEISAGVGYSSFSHFNKIFKKKYGITPSALRKNHNMQTI